jgi:hypothetical protein
VKDILPKPAKSVCIENMNAAILDGGSGQWSLSTSPKVVYIGDNPEDHVLDRGFSHS